MKIFVSYGHARDQVNALRLQALGAVHGFTVYVPPAHTRQPKYGPISAPVRRPRPLDPESKQKMEESDIVLGMVGNVLTDACRLELDEAQAAGKPMIVMAYPGHTEVFQKAGCNVVEIDPLHPEQAEAAIVQHVNAFKAKRTKKTLLAFGTLALGLLVVDALAPQE